MSKVLIFATEKLFSKDGVSTGPSLRIWEMAKAIQNVGHEVTIAEFFTNSDMKEGIKFTLWNKFNIQEFDERFDVAILAQSKYSSLICKKIKKTPIILDCYDPILIEGLSYQAKDKLGFYSFSRHLSRALKTFKKADLFLAASQRQKDYYVGILSILGRINPVTYQEELIKIVPTGICSDSLKQTKSIIRGKIVNKNDKVILWAGGAYPWFDLNLMIRAMQKISAEIPEAKLIIMGANNPRTEVSKVGYQKALELAGDLKLLNRKIFFIDWQPYNKRYNVYSEVDLVVNTHKNLIETDYSFRTRLIDYIWAELPIITTGGEEISKLLNKRNAGVVIPVGDESSLVQKTFETLQDKNSLDILRNNVREVKKELSWQNCIKPILHFLAHPKKASDLIDKNAQKTFLKTITSNYSWVNHFKMLFSYFKKEEDKLAKIKNYIKK